MKIWQACVFAIVALGSVICLTAAMNALYPREEPIYMGAWYGEIHVDTPDFPTDLPGTEDGTYEG